MTCRDWNVRLLLGLDLDYICTWLSLSATRSLCWSHWKPASSLHRHQSFHAALCTLGMTSPWPVRSPGANRLWPLWPWPAPHVILTTPMTSQGETLSAAVYRRRWRMMTASRVPVQLCGKRRHYIHTEWLHHLNCLLWVASCLLLFFFYSFLFQASNYRFIIIISKSSYRSSSSRRRRRRSYNYVGSGDSSVVRAPDSWSKGRGFEYLHERRENFLLQGQLSVLTLFSVSVPPPCYRSST